MRSHEKTELDPERTRAFLFQAARRVTTEVRRQWRQDPKRLAQEIGMGADGTPTKQIDKLAEDVILRTLESADLPLNVVSEECGYIDNGAEHTLVMDPVDGTRNATHNIPFFCVALAIGKKSVTDLEYALVRNIANEDTFWARKGHGTTLNGEPVKVRPLDEREILIAALYEKEDASLARFWGRSNIHVRDMGSSALEMALVASGSFDAFVSHEEFLRVTDVAASTLLVREAGGEVYTADGNRLDTPFEVKAKTSVFAFSHPRLKEVLM
jgi:fructose-1,6-bisphosphatase/inositol monophosphatase family enzyme